MLIWIGLLACWFADRTAAALAWERPYYRPLALLLAGNVAAELTRYVIRVDALTGLARPFSGLTRALFHAEQAAGLVWPVGVAAVALLVLAKRPAWPALAAGGVALAVRVALYPWLRGDRLAWLLLGEQAALVVLGVWAGLQFWKREQPVRIVNDEMRALPAPWLLEHHRALGWLLFVEALQLVGPHLIAITNGDGIHVKPGNPFERWHLAQIGYSCLFAGLAIQQGRWRWRSGD